MSMPARIVTKPNPLSASATIGAERENCAAKPASRSSPPAPKSRALTPEKEILILDALAERLSLRAIARLHHVTRSTVTTLLEKNATTPCPERIGPARCERGQSRNRRNVDLYRHERRAGMALVGRFLPNPSDCWYGSWQARLGNCPAVMERPAALLLEKDGVHRLVHGLSCPHW